MLKRYGIGLSKEALLAALTNPKAEVRGLVAQKLAIDKDKDAIPFILNAISVENSNINRVHMALDLAELGDRKGVDLLENACSDQNTPGNLRVLAAQDMLQLGNKECLADVLALAKSDTEEGNRQVALSLLPQYFSEAKGTPEEVLNLICGSLIDGSAMVRLEAVVVLGELGNSQQVAALEDALTKEPEQDLRIQMAQTLGKLKSKPRK
ncbi:MAG: HEAT repeat domain-containing protein [Acidobacteriota bacterium]|nr:HEAT repeat domain-containing protein [Acidobacteriota bacterium]